MTCGKRRLPNKSEWVSKHPTQIMKQAKRVWKWSVETSQGKAWLYFVFAICQWLPTNHRMHYSKNDRCNLCLTNSQDDMNHLLLCPALLNEHLVMKEEMKSKFSQWNIPLSSIPLHSREQKTCKRLFIAAREKTLPSISDSRLVNLTKAYWKANRFKQHISTENFLQDLNRALNIRFPNRCVYLRNDLLALLIQTFTLQTHGFTDSEDCFWS